MQERCADRIRRFLCLVDDLQGTCDFVGARRNGIHACGNAVHFQNLDIIRDIPKTLKCDGERIVFDLAQHCGSAGCDDRTGDILLAFESEQFHECGFGAAAVLAGNDTDVLFVIKSFFGTACHCTKHNKD